MKTRAIRLHGERDLRLDIVELPEITDDQILAKVVTDSVCMSTYKAAIQGNRHKRVPENIKEKPIVIGHEFSGEIISVGKRWKDQFLPGQRFSIQPNINYLGKGYAPGYSFEFFGGDAEYIIIPPEVMEKRFLLAYTGDAFYKASLSEPMSCIVAAFHAQYHIDNNDGTHIMGPAKDSVMGIFAGVGPMGLGAIDYAIHGPYTPKTLVVTDIDDARLKRAASILTVEDAKAHDVDLHYVNTSRIENPEEYLMKLSNGNGYDDLFVFAPVASVVELADTVLANNGCLNFFSGPTDKSFSAKLNFYNVHYSRTHIAGTSGGSTADMQEALDLMSEGKINPSVMITHIGGLDSAAKTTLELPSIPGGKKLIYTHLSMDLLSLNEIVDRKGESPLFHTLADIIEKNNGLWSPEVESALLNWMSHGN